jgi:ABC-type antimicrobial peptide transport system permease subunit
MILQVTRFPASAAAGLVLGLAGAAAAIPAWRATFVNPVQVLKAE